MNRKYLFVNWQFVLVTSALAFLSFAFIDGAAPADEGDFFDHNLDGLWAGYLRIDDVDVPAVINVNAGSNGAIGSVIMVADITDSMTDYAEYAFKNVSVSNNGLDFTITIPNGNSETDLDFNLSIKSGELRGDYDSNQLGSEDVRLFQLSGDDMIRHLWVGDNKGNPTSLELQRDDGELDSEITIIDEDTELFNIAFDGKRLTAMMQDDNNLGGDLSLKFKSKKQLLRGKISLDVGGTVKAKMFPVGGSGKGMKVSSVSPGTIDIASAAPAATGEITIKGKNFQPGAMVHLDYPGAEVLSVSVSKNSITAMIMVPDSAPNGAQISVLVVNPDNQQGEETNAITVVKEDSGGGGGGTTVSFANDIQPIFTNSCVECHGGSGGLFLSSGQAYNNLVGVVATGNSSFNRVTPGDPDNSYLVMKLRGDSRAGSRMPLGRTPLSNDVINLIVTWINEGAQNN